MPENLTRKLIASRLVSGDMAAGSEIGLRFDQTLLQDATGTMACLQFEAMGVPRVKVALAVVYVDHNILQTSYENADDHRYLQTVAAKYGMVLSRAGNGICHQVHPERFGIPGASLVGADSHTPTCGALGMLAVGAGGLDVAAAMAGQPIYLTMPRVHRVILQGRLPSWVAAKDVILELLRRLSVKGGVGAILEYTGDGLAGLSVPQRATIANMGAELGATTSVFPSDEQTLQFLRMQGRGHEWQRLEADPGAVYEATTVIDLNTLEPLVACPSSPDNVVPVRDVEGTPIAQVCIGSCTNSSYVDLMTAAAILRGGTVHPQVSLTISPGTKQVYTAIARNGALADLIAAGARVLESACGPCVGMGQSPATGVASLRSINRNFPARSGTPGDRVYLGSVEVCAASALLGELTDPRRLGDPVAIVLAEQMPVDDNMLIWPPEDGESVVVERGPNIVPVPAGQVIGEALVGPVLVTLGDNVTTDHIVPAWPHVLKLRSNVPAIAEFTLQSVDPGFVARAKAAGGGLIVSGTNYGQGSSREHAALAPMYLGVRAVVAVSFARIHLANLVNCGILPLTFLNTTDYEAAVERGPGDQWEIPDVRRQLPAESVLTVGNRTTGAEFPVRHSLSARQVQTVLAGGLLAQIRGASGGSE